MIGFIQHGRFRTQQVCVNGGCAFWIVCLQAKDVRVKKVADQNQFCMMCCIGNRWIYKLY